MKTQKTLTLKALNRATLARQWLLERHSATPLQAIEQLVGLQAQLAKPPYFGLWTRLASFERAQLSERLIDRTVVRVTSMRGTLHLMTAKDFGAFRSVLAPVLDRGMRSILRDRLDGIDLVQVVADARRFLSDRPTTFEPIRDHLVGLHPKNDERALGYAVRCLLPLVQVPDGGPWGFPGSPDFALAEDWVGKALGTLTDPKPLVLRYLASFGPATSADAQSWSGLQKLADTFEELRPKLSTFVDEQGRELFDLPQAPRPDSRTPAPVRFLPNFDNLLLGHADRSRVISEVNRKRISPSNTQLLASFLVDGFVAGTWSTERKKQKATLLLAPFEALTSSVRTQLKKEGESLLRFVEPDAAEFVVSG